ncbi:MAG: tripartite tricarboxylate transporter substrate-binding protein, partial [Cupriavidus necator]
MFDVMTTSKASIESGKLRALASTGPNRSPETPSLPAVAETIPGFELTGWSAIVAPAGVPAGIVQRLAR